MLFDQLPQFPPALPDEDLAFLQGLSPGPSEWDLLDSNKWAAAKRLERRGLVKISMCEGDMWAQKTPAASLRLQN